MGIVLHSYEDGLVIKDMRNKAGQGLYERPSESQEKGLQGDSIETTYVFQHAEDADGKKATTTQMSTDNGLAGKSLMAVSHGFQILPICC